MFGKDGHHVVVLTGPGTVWLQSMPLPILATPFPLSGRRKAHESAAGAGVAGGVLGGMIGRKL